MRLDRDIHVHVHVHACMCMFHDLLDVHVLYTSISETELYMRNWLNQTYVIGQGFMIHLDISLHYVIFWWKYGW